MYMFTMIVNARKSHLLKTSRKNISQSKTGTFFCNMSYRMFGLTYKMLINCTCRLCAFITNTSKHVILIETTY